RWGELLAEHFHAASERIGELPAGVGATPEIEWFPERGWGGRFYVPAIARAHAAGGGRIEYFGYVSFERPEEGEAEEFKAVADFTDVLADDNPTWKIDLNDDVIGSWRGEASRKGDVTLIWGMP